MWRDEERVHAADAVHGLPALDLVDGHADGMVPLQVFVVEDGVAGKYRGPLLRLYGERLAAHRVAADVERADAGQDVGRLVVQQHQPVARFAGQVGEDVAGKQDIGHQAGDGRIEGQVQSGARHEEFGVGKELGVGAVVVVEMRQQDVGHVGRVDALPAQGATGCSAWPCPCGNGRAGPRPRPPAAGSRRRRARRSPRAMIWPSSRRKMKKKKSATSHSSQHDIKNICGPGTLCSQYLMALME